MEDSFISLVKKYPGKVFMILVAVLATGAWIARAEDSHRQIPQIVQGLDTILKEKEIELEAQKRVQEHIAKLCKEGKIKDLLECAKAGVEIK